MGSVSRVEAGATIESFDSGVADSPCVVVVIPAYNEERFIASVVFQTRAYATWVIVVDDGSSDRTAAMAKAAGAQVVQQLQNMGKAEALNAGFRAARALHPRVLVCLDADAQHEPAEIPRLIKPILQGQADVVIGSRFLTTKSRIPAWRKIGQHTLTTLTNTLSGVKVTDSQSGYRAFSATAVQALRFHSQGLSVESEMQFLFEPAALKVVEVPISVRYQDGNKRNPVVHGLQVLDALLSLVARRRPLTFFAIPGFILALVGFVLGLEVMDVMKHTGTLLLGTSVLTAILLIGGLLMGLTGIILHSITTVANHIRADISQQLSSLSATQFQPQPVPVSVGREELQQGLRVNSPEVSGERV